MRLTFFIFKINFRASILAPTTVLRNFENKGTIAFALALGVHKENAINKDRTIFTITILTLYTVQLRG